MSEKVKVISLEIENVKRVQAVHIVPDKSGLTVIGGDNRQGKSSCLDAICAALGGERFNPSDPIRKGETKGVVSVTLSNGITAKRIFTPGGSRLELTGSEGKSGQSLLNDFISVFALDLSKFLGASDKEKASILLGIIGVDLQPLEEKEKNLESERLNYGRLEKKAKGHAESLVFHEDAGNEIVTADKLMGELQTIVTHNAANRKTRQGLEDAKRQLEAKRAAGTALQERVEKLKADLEETELQAFGAETIAKELETSVMAAETSTEGLVDQDDTDIKAKMAEIDGINIKVRANLDREKAFSEAEGFRTEYQSLADQIDEVRRERAALLEGAEMPLEGLSVANGVLVYREQAWDCMSHSEQLIAATAICQKTNENMGFVLVDKLEAMDIPTLNEYRAWLKTEDLQAIATRVSTGGECTLIIEDGQVAGSETPDLSNPSF